MLQPDTVLQSRYRVVRKLGQGGMGAVYEALDTRLRSTVALKQTLVDGDQLLRAFEREAQLLSNLQHPALPHVIDYFAEEHGQFLVMQFIAGEDLGAMLKREKRPAPVGTVLAWADQLLDVLSYLHANDPPIVHRDIKPDNLKLTTRGTIVLLDFGLAKGSTSAMTRAATGSILGYTPSFAPLEQIRGQGTDVRSDLYAAAATLYALLAAEIPADALTRADGILNSGVDPLRRLDAVNSEVPSAVADVLHAAMALRRDDRPATAFDMRSRLAAAGTSAVPSPGLATRIGGPETEPLGVSFYQASDPLRTNVEPRSTTSPPSMRTEVEPDMLRAAPPARPTAVPTPAAPVFATGSEAQGSGPARMLIFGGIFIAALVTIGGVAIWKINPWSDATPAASIDKPSPNDKPASTASGLATNASVAPAPDGFVPVPAPQPPPSTGSANPDTPKVDSTVKPAEPPQAPADAPPADREGSENVRLGPGIARTAIKKSQPSYPPMAKAAGIEGDVVVEIVVNESGSVVRARAISGHPLLRDASVRAAREWTFKPTVRNGEPVNVIGTLTFYFRQGVSLRRDESTHGGSGG